MADADRGVELYPLNDGLGPCLFCGLSGPGTLATLDEEPRRGSLVFCGGCAGLHYLEHRGVPPFDELTWFLEKPTVAERLELLKRPDVQAVRDAYQLDQVEARMARSSSKDKAKPSAPRTAGKVRLGQNRLEARGPDA